MNLLVEDWGGKNLMTYLLNEQVGVKELLKKVLLEADF
jgi:hypothetical protein